MPPKAERKPRQSKKQTIKAVVPEPVPVEPVPVEPDPVYSDDEEEPQNEIIETIEEVEEEEEEEDEDMKEMRLLEAKQQELKNKIKAKEIRKNIINIRKNMTDALKNDLKNKEELLNHIQFEIESIKKEIEDVDNGSNDELLIRAEIALLEKPQTIKAVKKDKTDKKEGVRVSTKISRPKNLASCFKRDTLIHHNKGGNNEYALVYAVNGKVHRCNEEMKNIGESYETLNAFTNENYKRKNEREGRNRVLRNNAYAECLYKNDAGIWCCCLDLIDGNILTEK